MQSQTVYNHQASNQSKRNAYVTYTKPQSCAISSMPSNQPQTWLSVLPPGWKREECMRPLGLGTGKSEVYYISPQGQIVRTKQEMQVILGDKYDVALFDWRSGRFNAPNQKHKRSDDSSDVSNTKVPRLDGLNSFPVRRSLPPNEFKPVIVRSHPECKRTEVKNTTEETPHQLFWEKRLANTLAINPDTGEPFRPLSLPKGIQSAGVPGYQPTQVIHSLIHSLSSKTTPITGQEQQPSAIEKNPCVTVNHLQPMIKTYIVTDDDIRRQEARVKELRKKLENARKRLHPRYETEREG